MSDDPTPSGSTPAAGDGGGSRGRRGDRDVDDPAVAAPADGPPTLGNPSGPVPVVLERSAPPPAAPRRGLSVALIVLGALAAVALAVVLVTGMADDDTIPTPGTAVPLPADEPDDGAAPLDPDAVLRPPDDTVDRHLVPVACDGFSAAVRTELGEASGGGPGLPGDFGATIATCTFGSGPGVVAITTTYPADDAGNGSVAAWNRLQAGTAGGEVIADLADGAVYHAEACEVEVASSNARLVVIGDPAAAEGCRDQVVPLAEDFVATSLT